MHKNISNLVEKNCSSEETIYRCLYQTKIQITKTSVTVV